MRFLDGVARWCSASSPRRGLIRQLSVALVIGGIAGAITAAVLAGRPSSYVATARLTLTEEVVWPFFDTVREEQQVRLEDSDLRVAVNNDTRATTGGTILDMGLALPKAQTFLELEVLATMPDAAAFGANAAADRIIAADDEAALQVIRDEIVAVEQVLVGIGPGQDEETSIQRGTQRSRLSDLERARDNYQPRVELVRQAVAPTSDQTSTVADAVIAALLVGSLVLAALRVLAYRRGSTTTVPVAASLAGAEVLGIFDGNAELVLGGGDGSMRNFFLHFRGALALSPVGESKPIDVASLAEQLGVALARDGRRVVVLSDRPSSIGPENCLRRAQKLDAGEVLRVTLDGIGYDDFADTAFPTWMRDVIGSVDVVFCAVDTSERGDLLARFATTVVHVGPPDLTRNHWRSVGASLQGFDGQRLVAFAEPPRAVDLRVDESRSNPAVLTA